MGLNAALLPKNEEARLAAVRQYGILDTGQEEVFDRLTALAASLIGTPIAMLSFVDSERVWLKARLGTDTDAVSRDQGFCAQAILEKDPYVVTDAAAHDQWRNSSLVTDDGLRFYAGAPIRTGDGLALGVLSVADLEPREVSTEELRTLADLASLAMHQLDLRRSTLADSSGTSEAPETIAWEDPPPRKVRPTEEWAPLLAQVSQRPGHWAKLRHYSGETSAYRAASQLRHRDDLPEGHWEFLARRSPEGGSDLFARVSAEEAGDRRRRR